MTDVMELLAAFLEAFLVSVGISVAAISAPVEGRASVIDGDSLTVGQVSIRLHAIDAPKGKQICKTATGEAYDCGARSTAALKQLINGRAISCQKIDEDRYRRIVSKCYVGELDLGAALVMQGMAVAYTDFVWDYATLEATARNDGIGLWAGSFETSSQWRKARR